MIEIFVAQIHAIRLHRAEQPIQSSTISMDDQCFSQSCVLRWTKILKWTKLLASM